MDSQSKVQEFLGPVHSLQELWTNLEDGSLVITPEHNEKLMSWWHGERPAIHELLKKKRGGVVSGEQLEMACTLDQECARMANPVYNWDMLRRGVSAYAMSELMFYSGALAYKTYMESEQCKIITEMRSKTLASVLPGQSQDTPTSTLREYATLQRRMRSVKPSLFLRSLEAATLLLVLGSLTALLMAVASQL